MEFWLWMPQLFACTRARIKTQINRGLSPIIAPYYCVLRPIIAYCALLLRIAPYYCVTGISSDCSLSRPITMPPTARSELAAVEQSPTAQG